MKSRGKSGEGMARSWRVVAGVRKPTRIGRMLAKKGGEVVGGHFFEGVESGEGEGEVGGELDESAQVVDEFGVDGAVFDEGFEGFKFVEDDD